jgi:hypothetical protein
MEFASRPWIPRKEFFGLVGQTRQKQFARRPLSLRLVIHRDARHGLALSLGPERRRQTSEIRLQSRFHGAGQELRTAPHHDKMKKDNREKVRTQVVVGDGWEWCFTVTPIDRTLTSGRS